MSEASQEIHGTSKILIHDGKLEEFKQLVAQCVEIVRTQDVGTIEYNMYLNAEGTECFVHERYRDSAAGLRHMENIAPMMEALLAVCSITGEICGSPNPELRQALKSAGVTIYQPLQSTRG